MSKYSPGGLKCTIKSIQNIVEQTTTTKKYRVTTKKQSLQSLALLRYLKIMTRNKEIRSHSACANMVLQGAALQKTQKTLLLRTLASLKMAMNSPQIL